MKTITDIERDIAAIKFHLNKLGNSVTTNESVNYYEGNHTMINNRKMEFVHEGKLKEDVFKSNTKISKNDYRTIVDQLTSYLLGKEPSITDVDKKIIEEFPLKKAWRVAKKALKQCQIQKVAWVQPYINKKGKIDFVVRKKSDNIIPIYTQDAEEELEYIILYYDVDILVNGKIETVAKIEYWDKEQVTYYKSKDKKITLWDIDEYVKINPKPHIYTALKFPGGQEKQAKPNNWGKVPFIPLWFNDEQQTALEMIGREKIDALDYLLSDGCNNFLDMADVIYILKDYIGDPEEALFNLKTKRAAAVGEKGNVDSVSNEIPMESRKMMIEIMKAAIYEDGMGVDLSNLTGGSLTNVLIEAYFEMLNMKANNVAEFVEELYTEMLNYVNIKVNNFENDIQMQEPSITFNKTIIVNQIEYMEIANASMGAISDETRWANDPRVDDPLKEAERVLKEDGGSDGYSQ